MNVFEEMFAMLAEAGLPGLAVALVVLIGVFMARRGGLVVTGKQARLANLIIAVIASGLDPANAEAEGLMVAVIGAVVSALVYELLKWVGGKFPGAGHPPALNDRAGPLDVNPAQPK